MSQYVRQFEVTPGPGKVFEPPSSYGLGPDLRFLFEGEKRPIPEKALKPLKPTNYKNCVPTAMARLNQTWDAINEREIRPFTLDDTLKIYERMSPFRENVQDIKDRTPTEDEKIKADKRDNRNVAGDIDEHNDYGVSLLQALRTWTDTARKPLNGLLGEADYFLEVEWHNMFQLREAVWRFGGVLLGLALPLSIQLPPEQKDQAREATLGIQAMFGSPDSQAMSGSSEEKKISELQVQNDWYVPGYGPIGDGAPGSLSSHCVAITGYTPRAFYCQSGNLVRSLSEEFVLAYTEECFTILPTDVLAAQYPELKEEMRKDVDKLRTQDRPLWMPNFTQRWRGGNIMAGL